MRWDEIRAGVLPAVLLGAGFLVSCVTGPPIVRPDGSIDGRVVYERRCAQCHALRDPKAFSDEEWAENVRRFAPRAGVPPEWRPALISWLQQANDPSGEAETEGEDASVGRVSRNSFRRERASER